MKLKDIIINEFLNTDRRNFSIYQTNFNELSQMYDKLIASLKSGEKFKRFLTFENAITSDGKIKLDMTVDFYDKETKKNFPGQKIAFKYPVYYFFYDRYTQALEAIKEKELQALKTL